MVQSTSTQTLHGTAIYAYIEPSNHPSVGIYGSPVECLRYGSVLSRTFFQHRPPPPLRTTEPLRASWLPVATPARELTSTWAYVAEQQPHLLILLDVVTIHMVWIYNPNGGGFINALRVVSTQLQKHMSQRASSHPKERLELLWTLNQ